VWEHDRRGQLLYHHAWCTDWEGTADNGAAIVCLERSRWKIEKEQVNIQKNHGYELEHNYGHGQRTLSMVFYLLNLLAFIAHMLLERGDRLSQRCLATTARRELWHTLRTAMHLMLVTAWADFLLIYLDEAGPRPYRAWGQAGTSLERPVGHPGVMQMRREASTRHTEETLRQIPKLLVRCLQPNPLRAFRPKMGRLSVSGKNTTPYWPGIAAEEPCRAVIALVWYTYGTNTF
jgi:hypothetical protein